MSSLAERLGFRATDRIVILSADSLGACHASNIGVFEALRMGVATDSSIMMPGPWARHAAAHYRGEAVGVQLTLNAELDDLRGGPITYAPSLFDGDGGFPRTVADLWDHADLDEVRRECRAQLERAVLWGFDVTHLTSHMSAMELRPEFFDVYLDLGCEFNLPLRLSGVEVQLQSGFPFRDLAAEEFILFPDNVISLRGAGRNGLERVLRELPEGVTEVVIEPATDTPELRALDPRWAARVEQLDFLTRDSNVKAILQRGHVKLTSYRALRDLQQASR